MVLEAKSREYVESRVRAGVLEQGTVDLMAELGVDARLRRESMIDDALDIRFSGKLIHLNLPGLSGGKLVHIYGQQEVVKDLIAANLAHGLPILFEAEATGLDGLTGEKPTIRFKHDGKDEVILMINNLGGISELEITSIVNDTMSILKEQKILVKRVMAGSFMVRLLAKKSPSTLTHLGVRHLFISDITQSSWVQHHPSSPA